MAGHHDNNPWAEKLSQVTFPDQGAGWTAMEQLLDKEMPIGVRRDKRRWFLLILLLLLLIGVCNCPGRGRWFHGKTTGSQHPTPNTPTSAWSATDPGPIIHQPAPDTTIVAGSPTAPGAHAPKQAKKEETTRSAPDHLAGGKEVVPADQKTIPGSYDKRAVHPLLYTGDRRRTQQSARKLLLSNGGRSSKTTSPIDPRLPISPSNNPHHTGTTGHSRQKVRPDHFKQPGHSNSTEPQLADDTTGVAENGTLPSPPVPGSRLSVPRPATLTPMDTDTVRKQDSTMKHPKRNPALVTTIPKKDSTHKKPSTPSSAKEQTQKEHGFMAGIGLNQFFPVGGQQSPYNSSGSTGTLSDYIPVPMFRYYVNRKLYIQLEAQFNTPQSTKRNLVISQPPLDSIAGTLTRIQSSASIQQLYYFNLPLSVHYKVFDRLDVGAGLQFSRLSNAIGAFDSTFSTLGSTDTVNKKNIKSFKSDPLYQQIRTNEFRFLIDVNYTYKHFILGLRYNQALSKFVNIQVAPGQVTQGRNSSLQLYGKYILWDGRKRNTCRLNRRWP